jgi:acyl carrier protein
LDDYGQPVPIGVPGELCIGGIGLARGYLNQPELTAQKFIANPFSDDPKARFYRTGDTGRYRPDGSIEFLGRIDNQVKIRGYRIELGEIESVLNQHAAVRESVVIADARLSSELSEHGNRNTKSGPADENPQSERRLVAYAVVNDNPAPSINDLRNFLKAKLPDYMIPSAFVFLESLPLTPNGKVDRKALAVPDHARPELDAIYVRPRNPVEELLAEIWAEVLRIERIGIHDNFFDLGGHSLLATQVTSRLRDRLQIELPLRTLFEKPTIEDLAVAIIEQQAAGVPAEQLSGILAEIDSLSSEEIARQLIHGMK